MIDIQKLSYQVRLLTADGKQYDLTALTESAGWEENDGELAVRLSVSLVNEKVDGKYLSDLAVPGALLSIRAGWGDGAAQVARGIICEWEPSFSGESATLELVAYDELYTLQQSQDNAYFEAGTGTKAAVQKLLSDWGVPLEKYDGPDLPHGKLLFKNEPLGTILLKILDDAVSLGGPKSILRCTGSKVSVLPLGSNPEIYQFSADNVMVSSDRLSVSDLVTRVKVVGREDSAGRQPVEAVLDGRTEFGVRQRLYVRPEKDSLDAAKKEARRILDEDGEPQRDIRVESPDVPPLRRGDKVYISAVTLHGYFFVLSVQHDAGARSMSMDLTPVPDLVKTAGVSTDSAGFNKGDSVILNGPVYGDSYGNAKGMTFTDWKGTITIKVDTSRPCPYHVDWLGWVYPESITKA